MIYATAPTKKRQTKPWAPLKTQPKIGGKPLKIIAVIFLLLGSYHVVERCLANRQALRSKYAPTVYPRITRTQREIFEDGSWQWLSQPALRDDDGPILYTREALLAGRAEWSKLGKGFEGETFKYRNHVVKVFDGDHSPFRNCVPGWQPEVRWPTEISASLIVNGMKLEDTVNEQANVVPITDYFVSPGAETESRRWHLVTPLLPFGDLGRLARRLKESGILYTPRDLDAVFRPSFNRLLDALDNLHRQHDLCHDDVKMDNIFLASPHDMVALDANATTHWLLADLGNVRERGHPFHVSSIWMADNLPDCQLNDVVRLLKTYMQFLRESVHDASGFDRAFMEGKESWARLFWSVFDSAPQRKLLTAFSTKELSLSAHKPGSESTVAPSEVRSHSPWHSIFVGKIHAANLFTKRTLRIRASETGARRWGLVPLLGMPQTEC